MGSLRDMADRITSDPDVRYCVTAVIDLLGFSSHLETGGNDVRTTIGREAIARLKTLEEALTFLRLEIAAAAFAYPKGLWCQRINDAIILGLDLPDFLAPGIGETAKRFSAIDLGEYFDLSQYDEGERGEERFMADFAARLQGEIQDLIKFIGVVSRIHLFVNVQEHKRAFPGAKSICVTGFRRRFIQEGGAEDQLAANFSFANAFVADRELHGACLYVDDTLARLLCADRFARNIVRYACWVERPRPFDVAAEYPDDLHQEPDLVLSEPHTIRIFRKTMFFREMNTRPLSYLQVLERLRVYLTGAKTPATTAWPASMLALIRKSPSTNAISSGAPPRMIFPVGNISSDIRVFPEVIEEGASVTMEAARSTT